jgi:hypothetical protein
MGVGIFDLSLTVAEAIDGITTISVEEINRQLAARNEFIASKVDEMLNGFTQPVVSEGYMLDVSPAASAMAKVGEYGQAYTEVDRQFIERQFPLFKFSKATGWTEEFLRRATIEEFRKGVFDVEYAYQSSLLNELKAAIFNNIPRQHNDKFASKRDLTIRPFYNGDGQSIPIAPDGTSFTAATHTHYNGTSGSSLSVYDIDTLLINNVVEHGDMKGIALFVPSNGAALLSAVSGTKFLEATRPNVVYADNANRSAFVDNLDSNPNDKLIGAWNGYPVFTKTWVPANYIVCVATGAATKALGYRQDKFIKGLTALPEIGNNIITAKEWRAYFGMGALNRGAGAVLKTDAQTTYTAPSGLVL